MSIVRRIWSLLLPRHREAAVLLFAAVLVATVLETVSIGLVVPALAFLTRDMSATSPHMTRWLTWLGNPAPNRLTLLVLVGILMVYVARAVFLLCKEYWHATFTSAIQASTSRRLFALYLAQPWTFHLQRHSATLMRTINESQEFASLCGILFSATSESLVLVTLIGLLLWFEPVGTIVIAGMLGVAAWLFQATARPYSLRWNNARRHHSRMVIQHVQQGIGGAKEVIIRGCEREFLERFRHHTDARARIAVLQSLMSRVPRLWFELLAVAALLLLTAVLVWQDASSERVLPMLGLFAMVAFRMLPSVNNLTNWAIRLRSAESMLDHLANELTLAHDTLGARHGHPVIFRDALVIDGVSYRYPGTTEDVLHDVRLRIPHGTMAGVVGSSGAGKSTLIDVILGLLTPTAGRVLVDGLDIQENLRGWQDRIGYVSQAIYLCDDSIRRNVAFGVADADIDDEAVRRALQAAQLDQFVDSLPEGIETSVGERGVRLSGGQRQRIGIARALYHSPAVLVLDEATSALDTETEESVMAAVNALHGTKTVIIVAHRLTTVAHCDRLYRLDHGRIVQSGTYTDVVPASVR